MVRMKTSDQRYASGSTSRWHTIAATFRQLSFNSRFQFAVNNYYQPTGRLNQATTIDTRIINDSPFLLRFFLSLNPRFQPAICADLPLCND